MLQNKRDIFSDLASKDLEEKITNYYFTYFTSTGRIKKGQNAPYIVKLEEKLEKIKEEKLELEEKLKEYESLSTTIKDLNTQEKKLKEEITQVEIKIKKLVQETEKFTKLQTELSKVKLEKSKSESELKLILRKVKEIKDKEKKIETLKNKQKDYSKKELDLKKIKEEKEKKLEKLTKEIKIISEEIEKWQILKDKKYKQENFLELEKRIQEKQPILEQAQKLEKKYYELTEEIKKIKLPSAEEEKRILALKEHLKKLQIQKESFQINLELLALDDINITQEKEKKRIKKGEKINLKNFPEVELEIDNIAKIKSSIENKDIKNIKEKEEKINADINQILKTYNLKNIEEIERRKKEIERKQIEIDNIVSTIRTILNEKKLALFRDEINKIIQKKEELEKSLNLKEKIKESLEEIEKEIKIRIENLQSKNLLNKNLNEEISKLSSELNYLSRTQETVAEEINKLGLELEQSKLNLESLQQNALLLDMGIKNIKKEEERLSQELKKYSTDPTEELKNTEKKLEELQNKYGQISRELERAKWNLEHLSKENIYIKLAQKEEEQRKLEKEKEREQTKMQAIALLFRGINQLREKQAQELIPDLQKKASAYFHQINGRPGTIELDSQLTPQGVINSTFNLGLNFLSGGEKEQIFLALRLALADFLSQQEPQLLVLDDALPYTDKQKLANFFQLVEKLSTRIQFIFLTCHPERFENLPATFWNLEEIKLTGSHKS